MKDKIIELIDEFEERLKSLKEEYNDEELTYELGDKYWVVTSNGEVRDDMWTGHLYDEVALKNNALFKTKEKAEFEAERLKVLRELEKMGRAFRPYGENYSIELEYPLLHKERLSISIFGATQHCFGNYYFDTEEEAQEAINKIGEERIKKYLFGLED